MKAWWNARDAREQLILMVGGAIALLVLVYQFAWLPAESFRARAERDHAAALANLAAVQRAEANTVVERATPTASQPLQSVITRTAEGFGLTISRLVPAGDEGMNVFLDAAPPLLVYAWLGELERNYGVRVGGNSTLRKNSDNQTVSANIYLVRLP
jgi:general secretion pathway protein M